MSEHKRDKREKDREKIGDFVSLYRRGKIYYIEFYHNARQTRKSLTTRNSREARKRAIQIEAGLAAGRYDIGRSPADVADTIDKYVGSLEVEHRRESTLRRYRSELKRLRKFCEVHGVRSLEDLRVTLVDKYRKQR